MYLMVIYLFFKDMTRGEFRISVRGARFWFVPNLKSFVPDFGVTLSFVPNVIYNIYK